MRWYEIGPFPSSKPVMDWRRRVLEGARAPVASNRVEYLVSLSRAKRVLDVGCVDHAEMERPSWVHRHVREAASYCLGIDIQAKGIQKLKDGGYNVKLCDVTRDALDEKFDVVIAGEMIGHLCNPGALFEAARRVLAPGGRLVVTAPNPHYVNHVRHHWRGGGEESPDLTVLMFPSGVAELAERVDLRLVRWRGIQVEDLDHFERSRMLKAFRRVRPLLLAAGFAPEALCPTIIYEFVHQDTA